MDPLVWLAKIGLVILCVAGTSACGAREARVDYAAWSVNDPRQGAYRIGVSDVIRVTVWKDPSLSTDTTVRPDGKITVPLIGELEAGGRTAAEVQEQLVRRLAAFVKDAIVTVLDFPNRFRVEYVRARLTGRELGVAELRAWVPGPATDADDETRLEIDAADAACVQGLTGPMSLRSAG